jgi:hypothetical protein
MAVALWTALPISARRTQAEGLPAHRLTLDALSASVTLTILTPIELK